MKIVLALFAVCGIAAACGKKIEPAFVRTEMDLAILREDGGIYGEKSERQHEVLAESLASKGAYQSSNGKTDYSIKLSETRHQTQIGSELTIQLLDGTLDPREANRDVLGTLTFSMQGKALSEYGSFRESCSLAGDPHAIGTCRITSVVLNKDLVDPLGNKTRVFKHTSENYTRDHHGIRYCELSFDSAGVEWRSGEFADYSNRSYKYSVLNSQRIENGKTDYALTVTCYKNQTAGRGKTEMHSVFRGVFKQSR